MTKFRHSLEVRDKVDQLKLEGVLDEDSDLDSIGARLVESDVLIDLGEVERVNAGGAQAWWQFVEACESRGATVRVSKCSAAMVAQLNLKGSSSVEVERLALPYFCPECNEPRTLWVDAADLGEPPFESPVNRCDVCDLVMQFDDTPSYFQFLGVGTIEAAEAKQVVARGSHTKSAAPLADELSPEPESSPLMWVLVAAVVVVILVAAFLLAD